MACDNPTCHICRPTFRNIAKRGAGHVGFWSGAAKGALAGGAALGPLGLVAGLIGGGIWGAKNAYENPAGAALGLFNVFHSVADE